MSTMAEPVASISASASVPVAEERSEETNANTKQRFCFDSDVLVLKNNLE